MAESFRIGRNAFHVLEFSVHDAEQVYGVNVLKVGEVSPRPEVRQLPGAGAGNAGAVFWRGHTLPALSLGRILGLPTQPEGERAMIVLHVLNHRVAVFVHEVSQVHYIEWGRVRRVQSAGEERSGLEYLTAQARLSCEKILPILDFELILLRHLGIGDTQDVERGPSSLGGTRILYAEDSHLIRSRVTQILTAHGAEVVSTRDGTEALEFLRHDPGAAAVDVLITDLEMPRMDGFQLLTEVANDRKYAAMKTMIYTSLSHAQLESQARAAGADRVLTKFDDGELVAALGSLALNRG